MVCHNDCIMWAGSGGGCAWWLQYHMGGGALGTPDSDYEFYLPEYVGHCFAKMVIKTISIATNIYPGPILSVNYRFIHVLITYFHLSQSLEIENFRVIKHFFVLLIFVVLLILSTTTCYSMFCLHNLVLLVKCTNHCCHCIQTQLQGWFSHQKSQVWKLITLIVLWGWNKVTSWAQLCSQCSSTVWQLIWQIQTLGCLLICHQVQ